MSTTMERTEEKQILRGAMLSLDDRGSWARLCSIGGAAVWAGLTVLARLGIAGFGSIELLFLFGPLVIVPLGLELGREMGFGGRLLSIARVLQPIAVGLAVAAMWIGPGPRAALFASGWLTVCLFISCDGGWDLARALSRLQAREGGTWVRIAANVAKIDLAVGGLWLVASRLGRRPMGIQEPIGLLTAVHFHFAGFATAMIAAATLKTAEKRGETRWLRWIVLLVIGLPYGVAAGFVISHGLKMVAAVLFSMAVGVLAIFLRSCGRQSKDAAARVLLQISSAAVFAGMVLAGMYAVADFVGSDLLTIPQMARTHGILNAMGFCLAGLLGWVVEYASFPRCEPHVAGKSTNR